MEVIASSKGVRISPRKVRLVADSIRKMSAEKALGVLSQIEKRGAYPLIKTLKSAVANAVNKGLNKDSLFIKSLEVMEGQALKRYHPSSRGRTHPYKRKSSHIKIVLSDNQSQISNVKSQIKKKEGKK